MSKIIELDQHEEQAPTLKDLLKDIEGISSDIATLEEGKLYPYYLDGVEKEQSALDRAKDLSDYLNATILYQIYELLGYEIED